MSVKVVLDESKVKKIIDQKIQDGLTETTLITLQKIEHGQYVPKRSGDLAKSRILDYDLKNNTTYISWNMKYAAKVYYGIDTKFNTKFHKNAQAFWNRPITGNKELMKTIVNYSFKEK